MKATFSLLAIACLAALSACASSEEAPETKPTVEESAAPKSEADTRAKTEARLRIERSVDQWYTHFQKQEYATADGIAAALETHVDDHFFMVIDDLHNASPRFRKVAAAALGFSNRADAVPPLVEALHDPFEEVVLASLLSLWNLAKDGKPVPSAAVVPYLGHTAPDVRSNAALVLARCAKPGEGELFLPLTAAMEDSNDLVRVHAAAALGNLGDAGAVPFLVKGLADSKPLVRIRAAYALGRIKDAKAVPALIESIDDPDVDVSKASHKALQAITGREIERSKRAWLNYQASLKS